VLRLRPSRALGRSGFECSRDRLELQQRALEIVHDLAGDDLLGHTVVASARLASFSQVMSRFALSRAASSS
jgi:hypothetical protein